MLDVHAEPAGVKPWFVRKLPTRLEVLEDETVSLICYTGQMGCKPLFVKKLPVCMETQRGIDIEAECVIGKTTERQTSFGMRTLANLQRRSSSQGHRG